MDKREFYKQLMETYTVDTEKVKCNAKRRRAKAKTLNIQKWTAAAAACATVTAAGFMIVTLNSLPQDINPQSGVDIIDENVENAMERLRVAEKRYEEFNLTKAAEEVLELYVSLSKPLSRSEITMAFSAIEDYNDITMSLLYTSDGTCYQNTDNIGEGMSFSGVKILAPASLLSDIRMLKTVYFVEYAEDGITDESFVPLNSNPEQYTSTIEPISEPVQIIVPEVTTSPVTSGTTAEDPITADTSDNPSETTDHTTDEPDNTTTDTADSSSNSNEETEPPVTDETTDDTSSDTDTSTPEETTPEETETSETETQPPRGNFAVEIPLADIKTINFISDNHLVATTSDSIRLYSFTTESAKLETTFYASGAKITPSGADGTKLFITACDGEERKRLYYADGDSGLLCEIDVSYITAGGAELSSVSCNENASVILIKTVSLEKSCIYYATRSEGAISLLSGKDYTKPVSVLSYNDNVIYTAVTDPEDSSIRIYAVNALSGEETELAAFTGTLKYTRSFAKNMAFITITEEESEKYFLLSPAGAVIPLETSDVIFSNSDKRLVYVDKIGYTTEGGKLKDAGKTYTGVNEYNRFANYTYLLEKDRAYIIIKNG